MVRVRQILLSVVTAVLLVLSFPKLSQGWFSYVALVPLLYIVGRPRRSFILGWFAGGVFYAALLWWVLFLQADEASAPLLATGVVVLVLYLGLYFGLYATGGNAVFSNVHVPELYEVPGYATLSAGEKIDEALRKVLGNRKIKAFFTHEGRLKFSYFMTHDEGPSFEDTMFRSTHQRNDRFHSIVKVEGADGAHATYTSTVLLRRGRRFHVVSNPEITHREHAYREAMAIATETAELMGQATFEGLIDIRLEPEDAPEIVVARQNIAGDFLVDDITIGYKGGENPNCAMTVSTRHSIVL